MYCIKCGAKVDEQWKFCKSCGSPIPLNSNVPNENAPDTLNNGSSKETDSTYENPIIEKTNSSLPLNTFLGCLIALVVLTVLYYGNFFPDKLNSIIMDIIVFVIIYVGILFYNQKQYFALVLSIFFCLFIIGVVAYITKYRLW